MTSREKTYNRKIQELIEQTGRLKSSEVEKVIKLIQELQKSLAAVVSTTEWSVRHIGIFRESVDDAMERFKLQYLSSHSDALANIFNAGIDMIDAPFAAAGISVTAPEISITTLEIMQGYSGDLIKGLSTDIKQKINNEIAMGIMGGKTPYQVMEGIGKNLRDSGITKNLAGRAEKITRTEMGRVHSLSRQARMNAVVDGQTDPKITLQKKWHSSGKARGRYNHSILNNVVMPLDKKFPGGLDYPHAPGLPISEVANCGCTHSLTSPDWELLKNRYEPLPHSFKANYN